MSAPAFTDLPEAWRACAAEDYVRYVDACQVFDTPPRSFSEWWERYHDTYVDPFEGLA